MPSVLGNTPLDTQIALASDVPGGGGGYANATAVAPAFSTSETYPVGYFVTYNGDLYKCKTAVTTAGTWNASNWELTDCASNFGGGGGGGGNLPYDAEIQYVESDRGQYIDTGIPANTIVSAYGVFMTPTPGQRFYFGARTSQTSGNLATAFISGWGFRMAYGTNGSVLVSSNQTTAWTNAGFYGTTAFYNGASVSYTQSGTVTTLNAWLMGTNNNGSPIWSDSNVTLRLRSFVIETANGRVRDYIAVRKNGVGCLYDRVSKTFFYPENSEQFILGPDLDMDLYAPKESPAFTGTPTAPTAASGTNTTQVATTAFVQGEVGVKADKVVSATSGDFAGLDANGNLTDSGKKAADFVEKPPYDAEIEYLESTGTQFIDTGVTGGSDTKVRLVAYSENDSTNQTLFGARNSNGTYGFAVWQRAPINNVYGVRWDFIKESTTGVVNLLAGTWTSNQNTIIKDGPNNWLNGVQLASNTNETFDCNFPFYICGMNSGGSATGLAQCKIYSCQIWASGVLVRDYIPVRVGTTGYLYDRVSRTLFGNDGTGDFTLGPDKEYVSVGYLRDVITNQWEENPSDVKITFTSTQTGFTPTVRTLLVNRLAGIVHAEINVSSSSTRATNTAYTIATLSFTGFSCVKNQYFASYGFNKRGLFTINTSYSLVVTTLSSWAANNNDVFQVDFLTNSLSRQ